MLASRSHAPDCAELIRCATALQMIALISINHGTSSSTLKTRSRPLAQKLALSAPKPGSGQKKCPGQRRGAQAEKQRRRLHARFLRRRQAAAPPSRPPSAARLQPSSVGTGVAAAAGAGRQSQTDCVTDCTPSHMPPPPVS